MTTGVTRLFVSFVLLLLLRALLLMNREAPLAELVDGWALLALAVCGIGGLVIGLSGAIALSCFLQPPRNSPDRQPQRTDRDAWYPARTTIGCRAGQRR